MSKRHGATRAVTAANTIATPDKSFLHISTN